MGQMEEYVHLQIRVCKFHFLNILCGDKAKERWENFLPAERRRDKTTENRSHKLLAYLISIEEEVAMYRFPERLYDSHPLWAWLKGIRSQPCLDAAKTAISEYGRDKLLALYAQASKIAKNLGKLEGHPKIFP